MTETEYLGGLIDAAAELQERITAGLAPTPALAELTAALKKLKDQLPVTEDE